jgi:pimeloyl-ACP methyl ester carboxylesterase
MPDGEDKAYRERRISSQDNLSLYLRDYGDPLSPRTPVLCLTGLTRNCKDFHDLALALSRDRRVICPDYRGRGRSQYDADWRNYIPPTYLADIHHILAALNVHKVAVIGTSLGGLLAMGLGALMPAALVGVVLNDIGPHIEPKGLDVIIDYIRRDRPQPDMDAAERTVKTMMPGLSRRDPDIWRKVAENTFRTGDDGLLHFDWDPSIVMPLLKNPGIPDLWPYFHALRHVPVMAVRGGISDLLSEACLERMIQEKPEMKHVTVPDTGHAPTLSEPEVEQPLHDFIAAL